MSKYKIKYHTRINSQLEVIPKKIRIKIIERIEKLSEDPLPIGIEPLNGTEKGLFRIRQGDYRIVFQIFNKNVLVFIIRIAHRKEVYTKKHVGN